MPVEMRREDTVETVPAGPPAEGGESGAAALRDLVAARLVSLEAIGDPGRLAGEPAALRALCALVAGPVYRLAPFHYAFAVRPEDLGGRLAGLAAEGQTAALAAALDAALGPEAVWLGAAEPAPADADREADAAALPEAALLVLQAEASAVAGALAAAGPELRAVIDARFAAEAARRAGALAEALGLETAIRAATAALDRRLAALETLLETELAARAAAAAEAAAAQAAETRAFEARLGLALAEFLARLERRAAAAAP